MTIVNIKKTKKDLDEIEVNDPFSDSMDDYDVQQPIPFAYLIATQLLIIQRVISTDARQNPSRFRDVVEGLLTYISDDADNDKIFQDEMMKLIQWRQQQLKGFPHNLRQQKEFLLEFEYTFKKYKLITKLMHRKGYMGS